MNQELQTLLYKYLTDTLNARDASDLSRALNVCVREACPGTAADLTLRSSALCVPEPRTAKAKALVNGVFASEPFQSDPRREEWAFPVAGQEGAAAALSFYLPCGLEKESAEKLHRLGGYLCGFVEKQLAQMNRAYPQNALSYLAVEVKTPLSAALSSVQLAAEKLRRQSRQYDRDYRPILETAQRNIYRSLRMASNITDAERLEAGAIRAQPVCGDLAATVREIVDSVRPIAQKKGVELTLLPSAELCVVYSDFYLIERILLTLLSNALDAVAENTGHIGVCLSMEDTLRILVSDDGAGVPEQDREHIFEKYWSGMEPGSGRMGLGLYLARHFAELLPGELTAIRLETGDTCFELRIEPVWPKELTLASREPIHSDRLAQLVRTEFAGC